MFPIFRLQNRLSPFAPACSPPPLRRDRACLAAPLLASLLLAAVQGAKADSITFYDNTDTSNVFAPPGTSSVNCLDDVTPMSAPAGKFWKVTKMTVSLINNATFSQNVMLNLFFYAGMNTTTTSSSVIVNTNLITSFSTTLNSVPARGILTTSIDLMSLPGGGVVLPAGTSGVEMKFTNPGSTITTNDFFAPMLSGAGVTTGSSTSQYWHHMNASTSNVFKGNETDTLGGKKANFFLKMSGVAVPAPGSLPLFAIGLTAAMVPLWRRRLRPPAEKRH